MHLIVLLLVAIFFSSGEAIKCYQCSYTFVESDKTCLNSPPSNDCNRKYCTIVRQEYNDPPGKLVSFTRFCEDSPKFMDQIIHDQTFTTYYKACTKDLCNGGNGKDSDSSDDGGSDTGVIVVPGVSGSGLLGPPTLRHAIALVALLSTLK